VFADDLDPMRVFRESLAAQQDAFTAVSRFTDATRVVSDINAVPNWFQMFDHWRTLTGASDLERALRAMSELNDRLTGWSDAITAINRVLPDIGALRLGLSIPTAELRSLTDAGDALDEDIKRSLSDVATAVDEEDQADAPALVSDWLSWLPSPAQARLLILISVALNALIEYADAETGIEPPDHVTQLIYALAAVATLLNEYVAKGR
jgi:hypothetical protein